MCLVTSRAISWNSSLKVHILRINAKPYAHASPHFSKYSFVAYKCKERMVTTNGTDVFIIIIIGRLSFSNRLQAPENSSETMDAQHRRHEKSNASSGPVAFLLSPESYLKTQAAVSLQRHCESSGLLLLYLVTP